MQASSINLDALLSGKRVTPFGSKLRRDDFQSTVDGRPLASLIQLRLRGPETLTFALGGPPHIKECAAGGWIIGSEHDGHTRYWIPRFPCCRVRDDCERIVSETTVWPAELRVTNQGLLMRLPNSPPNASTDIAILKLYDSDIASELESLSVLETQGYFVLGSHTCISKPGDFYKHLVHGYIYEDRYSWPFKRRIFSENDAHALYLIARGLERATGKRIYRIIEQQIITAVLDRQSADGGFRHGEWTSGMESHFRLHCSAMHLIMDALSEEASRPLHDALKKGIEFLASKHDRTQVGVWFFHDELECTESGMQNAPFKWWPSRALGKAPQNMLVLNTHLDALVALDRYGALTGDSQYAPLVSSGFAAARAVLELKPMDWLYQLVFSAISLTLMPTERAKQLSLATRFWKRMGWKYFQRWLPRIKTRFPRLVMPGGYIDRELSLNVFAYDYLAVNLMDLVRAAHGAHAPIFAPFIAGIRSYYKKTGLAERVLEVPGRHYSIGFLAEALVLLCLGDPRPDILQQLADTLTLCVKKGIGLPPSILNGNREATPPAAWRSVPRARRNEIVVVNLSNSGLARCLILNLGHEPITLDDALTMTEAWGDSALSVAPGHWQLLQQA